MRTQEPRSGPRPWLLVAVVLLLILLTLGGVFIGLHLAGTPAPIPPTATSIPNPTSAATVAPTSVPPTPTPTPIPTTPTPSPAQLAQAVVQQYYNDINNTDYQGAYNLWGSSYQSSHSYSSFANGFANTVQDTVTFGTITPLSDGTVQVGINLQAVENSSSGRVTHTFQGYYIVGQENGNWTLLSSNIRKTS